MKGRLISFTNLYPSAQRPFHGLFVRDRMSRVVAASDVDWQVVSPRPKVPWPLKRRIDRLHAAMPDHELVDGVPVSHPAYFHLPGVSVQRQAARMARAALPVVAELAADGPCVLDAHYVYPDGVAALQIAHQLQLPCMVTARGTDLNVLAEHDGIRRQIRAASRDAFALLAVSRPLAERFEAVIGSGRSVQVARNGVDLERFRPGDALFARRELGLPEQVKLVLGVGRLVDGKGFHLMAKALRDLDSSVHFALVGEGPAAPRIRQLAPEGRLHLLGAQPPERVALCYQACDLLVLPSDREGWPNVVTEALASGRPVVATSVGAVPDMLASPLVGSMVRVGDSRSLGREVARWLQSSPDEMAIRRFAERFSWQETVELHVDLIERALSEARV
ncbi:MAG: glycosyltransferase [Planctomycetota bacterium]